MWKLYRTTFPVDYLNLELTIRHIYYLKSIVLRVKPYESIRENRNIERLWKFIAMLRLEDFSLWDLSKKSTEMCIEGILGTGKLQLLQLLSMQHFIGRAFINHIRTALECKKYIIA